MIDGELLRIATQQSSVTAVIKGMTMGFTVGESRQTTIDSAIGLQLAFSCWHCFAVHPAVCDRGVTTAGSLE